MPEVIFNGPEGRLEGTVSPKTKPARADRAHPSSAAAIGRQYEQSGHLSALPSICESRLFGFAL